MCYRNQSFNSAQGNNRCLFSDLHKHTLWAERRILKFVALTTDFSNADGLFTSRYELNLKYEYNN